jgi:hypothetical protein
MRHQLQGRAADVIARMFKLYKVRKSLAVLEVQFGGSAAELEAS